MTYAIAAVQKVSKRPVTDFDLYNMEHKGFNANLRRAPRLKGERVFGLPPGAKIPTFPVSCFPKAPESWVREAGSYVCPVDPNWALWFDWQDNDSDNTAVLPSVKGVNPITGRKTEGFALEQYAEKCPVHGVGLGSKRLCEKCGYQWPAQSYVASPNILWWDGWRQPDGTVRQFFFTEEDEKDIASAIIGKPNTMPAFGFAFYEPKVKTQRITYRSPVVINNYEDPYKHVMFPHYPLPQKKGVLGEQVESCYYSPSHTPVNTDHNDSLEEVNYSCSSGQEEKTSGGIGILRDASLDMMPTKNIVTAKSRPRGMSADVELASLGETGKKSKQLKKEVSVGAGARIDQNLEPDPRGLSEYKDEPSAIIRLYFVFQGQFNEILRGGFKHPAGDAEGFLKGLPTG